MQTWQPCIQTAVQAQGADLVGIEMLSQPVGLRIYVEKVEGPTTIELCHQIAKHVRVALQATDPEIAQGILEISSPGLDRRFFSAEQGIRFIGQSVRVSYLDEEGKRRKLQGTLAEVAQQRWRIVSELEEHWINFSCVEVARLVF